MDKNLKMGPKADRKFEKRNIERTKSSKNGTWKVLDAPSPSLPVDPLGDYATPGDWNHWTDFTKAMFTLYRVVKRSVAESVPDRASVHTRDAAYEAVSAPEQYCSAPLLKVERFVSDRFYKRSESSLNTFIGADIAAGPRFGKWSFQIKRERCKLHNGKGLCSHWERFGTISAPQQNINSCSHCTGATFETEQTPIRYSVNIA